MDVYRCQAVDLRDAQAALQVVFDERMEEKARVRKADVDWFMTHGDNRLYIAEDGGTFVGIVVAHTHVSPDGQRKRLLIADAYVLERHRGRGVGTALFAEAAQDAAASGYGEMLVIGNLCNLPAVRAIERAGGVRDASRRDAVFAWQFAGR